MLCEKVNGLYGKTFKSVNAAGLWLIGTLSITDFECRLYVESLQFLGFTNVHRCLLLQGFRRKLV